MEEVVVWGDVSGDFDVYFVVVGVEIFVVLVVIVINVVVSFFGLWVGKDFELVGGGVVGGGGVWDFGEVDLDGVVVGVVDGFLRVGLVISLLWVGF